MNLRVNKKFKDASQAVVAGIHIPGSLWWPGKEAGGTCWGGRTSSVIVIMVSLR